MRSRLAITTILVVGVVMSGAGTGLAVSGISGSGSAGSAQYPVTETTATTDVETVLPTTETNTPANTDEATPDTTRQLESNDSSQLPFTGYAAIPVLLAGLALLSVGLVMRRRATGRDQS